MEIKEIKNGGQVTQCVPYPPSSSGAKAPVVVALLCPVVTLALRTRISTI